MSYEESVTTREQNVSNAVTEFTVFGHSQVLGEFSTHTFKKNGGRKQFSVGWRINERGKWGNKMGTSYFFKEPGREEKEKGQEIVKYIGSRVFENMGESWAQFSDQGRGSRERKTLNNQNAMTKGVE